jgi:UDP:flavonoid glycosyltransferase YjiC (YdhE family)
MLAAALDAVLKDGDLLARLDKTSRRLQANPGTARAADLLEQLATTGEPVIRG